MDLTKKQEMFCKEYLIDLNATQAAIRAGYSNPSCGSIGSENLQKPEIQERIQELADERSKRVIITADEVLRNIKNIGERCMQAVPVTKFNPETKEYEQTGEYEFKENGALKAQELLGKHLKLFGADGSPDNPITVMMPQITVKGKPKEYNVGSDPDSQAA